MGEESNIIFLLINVEELDHALGLTISAPRLVMLSNSENIVHLLSFEPYSITGLVNQWHWQD